MLSQIAVQVQPDVMKLAVKVSEKYADAFTSAGWDAENMQKVAHAGLLTTLFPGFNPA